MIDIGNDSFKYGSSQRANPVVEPNIIGTPQQTGLIYGKKGQHKRIIGRAALDSNMLQIFRPLLDTCIDWPGISDIVRHSLVQMEYYDVECTPPLLVT